MALDAVPPKRRRNVAGPLAGLSPAYRKRLEGYARKHGVSIAQARQAARGHKPREHVARRQREQVQAATLGKLTSQQRSTIRTYIRAQIKRTPESQLPEPDPDLADRLGDERGLVETVLAVVERAGWDFFESQRARQRGLQAEWKAAGKPKQLRYSAVELGELASGDWEDMAWLLYYH